MKRKLCDSSVPATHMITVYLSVNHQPVW